MRGRFEEFWREEVDSTRDEIPQFPRLGTMRGICIRREEKNLAISKWFQMKGRHSFFGKMKMNHHECLE